MKRPDLYPMLKEPPYAHAVTRWNKEQRVLTCEYNGRPTIAIAIPGADPVDYRTSSDGDLQSDPLVQQIYVIVKQPVTATVTFHLSGDAVNMRPQRAGDEQAVLGQVGRPLMFGVNGLYDIAQDLLMDWQGQPWRWCGTSLARTATGDWVARLTVEVGPAPWFVNLRPHYYRKHLGYAYHEPWTWRPKTAPVAGWCSWEAYRRDVTEEKFRTAAEFVSTNFKPYGMEYLQLDDGYQPPRIPSSLETNIAEDWLSTNDRFPSGHQGIVKIAREHGLKPGIWIYTYVHNEEYARVKPGFLKDPGSGDPLEGEWIGFVVDCLPETLKRYVTPSFEGYRKLGYAYVKTDGLRHLIYDGLHEAVRRGLMTNGEAELRFRRYVECIRRAVGNDMFYLSSWGTLTQMAGIADACRIATDVDPSWGKMRMQMAEAARWFHTNRILFINDPDHLCLRAKYEWSRSAISLTSLSGGLFMLSDAPEEYDEQRIALVKKCLPPMETYAGETGPLDASMAAFTWTKAHGAAFTAARDAEVKNKDDVTVEKLVTAAGRYPTVDNDHPFSTLWAFHFDTPARRWCVAARIATTPLRDADICLEALGLDPEENYLVFDFWAQAYLGRFSRRLTCRELALGDCQILAFCPAADHPQFLASSRHVSMDAASVKAQAWADGNLTLTLTGVAGTREDYWVHVPGRYRAKGCSINGKPGSFNQAGEMIKIEVVFQAELVLVTVPFELL